MPSFRRTFYLKYVIKKKEEEQKKVEEQKSQQKHGSRPSVLRRYSKRSK